MVIQPGWFLYSTVALDNDFFAQAIIYLAECSDQGAVGFVVNKPFGRRLNELEEFKQAAPFALYEGGPVDPEHLFVLHRRPDLVAEGTPVAEGIFLGGNFNQAVAASTQRQLLPNDMKIFVGYCGWDAGELEAEIEEGSWILRAGDPDMVFAQVG